MLASLFAASGLGLAAAIAIAAAGPSVLAASESKREVYAGQCWLVLEERPGADVLYAHAAEGLSGEFELAVNGETVSGAFDADPFSSAVLSQADVASAPQARLIVTDGDGRRICDTAHLHTRAI